MLFRSTLTREPNPTLFVSAPTIIGAGKLIQSSVFDDGMNRSIVEHSFERIGRRGCVYSERHDANRRLLQRDIFTPTESN